MHMGHVRNYAIGDCLSRFKRLQGYDVLHPMGWDAFGLPAENAAIDHDADPAQWTKNNISTLKSQMNLLGFDYDWSREITTCDPDYYKWDQWIFLKLWEEGLVYRDTSEVNWCPGCETVLANEQVEDGMCWRCDSNVEHRDMNQWNIKITEYADELLDDLGNLNGWPDKVKKMQEDWIGRSRGATISFPVKETDQSLDVFTTRPDTIHGATFMAVAPEHDLAQKVAADNEDVKAYVEAATERDDDVRKERSKAGVFTGEHAVNPVTGDELPVYVAEFVLSTYGTGAVMAVPAHDQRDHDFAKEHGLNIRPVVHPEEASHDFEEQAYEDEGIHRGSGVLNGLQNDDAVETIIDLLEEQGHGHEDVRYTLQDWLISRQRYWGTPIPIVHCDECGPVPVPEADLPVELPDDVEFVEQGNPLDTSDSFKDATCPSCGGSARRETDTMDTFVNSSWYYLRYASPSHDEAPFDSGQAANWMPVDQYIGGIEHAVMHLLYARFLMKFLRDEGLTEHDEPFSNLLCQGMVHLEGKQMSKSKQHLVSPEDTVNDYGADTARTFMLFLGKPEKAVDWSDQGIDGIHRFLKRTRRLPYTEVEDHAIQMSDTVFNSKWNQLLQDVTAAMNDLRFNEAVKQLMAWQRLLNRVSKDKAAWKQSFSAFLRCLNPFAPHLTEELWHNHVEDTYCGRADWPTPDQSVIDERAEYTHRVAEKTYDDIEEVKELTGIHKPSRLRLILPPSWKYKTARKVQDLIQRNDLQNAVEQIMQSELRTKGDEVVSLVQTYTEDQTKLPSLRVSQEDDRKAAEKVARALDIPVAIHEATDSDDEKAGSALPSKPALVLDE